MNEIIFCPECRVESGYSVKECAGIHDFKGDMYEFPEKRAYCLNCGEEVFVPLIEEENQKTLYDAYRKRHGIISLEEVQSIPGRYSIGKQPLSLLLGWGAQTFSRYCDGYIPTKQYSEQLKKIIAEPFHFLMLLEENADTVTEMTYKKAKCAALTLMNRCFTPKTKIEKVSCYLASVCGDISRLALEKALYYTQGFYYAFNHVFFFEEDCQAWAHGPVYEMIWRQSSEILNGCAVADDWFTEQEKELLDNIVRFVCCYSGDTLERFTHKERPWLKTRDGLLPDARSTKVIPKDLIASYFSLIAEKYKMQSPSDLAEYMQHMFSIAA